MIFLFLGTYCNMLSAIILNTTKTVYRNSMTELSQPVSQQLLRPFQWQEAKHRWIKICLDGTPTLSHFTIKPFFGITFGKTMDHHILGPSLISETKSEHYIIVLYAMWNLIRMPSLLIKWLNLWHIRAQTTFGKVLNK